MPEHEELKVEPFFNRDAGEIKWLKDFVLMGFNPKSILFWFTSPLSPSYL